MSVADELAHTIKHLVEQQTQTRKPFAYGHIATYNQTTGTCRVVFPSIRNEDGTPTMSADMPLGTAWSAPGGKSYGMQICPYGGATLENPTAGEQVVVSILESKYGVHFAASLSFNQSAAPPRTDLLPGEMVMQGEMGSFARFHQNGDLEFNAQGKVIVNCTGDATVTAMGVATIVATAIKLTAALADTLRFLCTEVFYTWATTHTHTVSGSSTGEPVETPPVHSLTSVVQAE